MRSNKPVQQLFAAILAELKREIDRGCDEATAAHLTERVKRIQFSMSADSLDDEPS